MSNDAYVKQLENTVDKLQSELEQSNAELEKTKAELDQYKKQERVTVVTQKEKWKQIQDNLKKAGKMCDR